MHTYLTDYADAGAPIRENRILWPGLGKLYRRVEPCVDRHLNCVLTGGASCDGGD